MKKTKKVKNRTTLFAVPLYMWAAVLVMLPLVYVFGLSFLTRSDTWGVEMIFTLENYAKIFSPTYFKVFAQSIFTAFLTTVLTLLIGYPFAYSVAKLSARWRSVVMVLLVVPFWTNSLVRIYGWMIILRSQGVLNSILISLGLIETPLKLLYNFGSVLVGMVYALLPFMILAIYNSVEKLDWSLVEASRDLGASPFKAFWSVTIPLTAPGIFAGSVLVFIPTIGLFFISDLLGGAKTMLVGNLIKNELLTARNWPMGAALSIVMMVMAILIITLYKKLAGDDNLEGLI